MTLHLLPDPDAAPIKPAAHSPGPWMYEAHECFGGSDPGGDPWPFGYISNGELLSPIFELSPIFNIPPATLTANARLMAASPTMHAALERIEILAATINGANEREHDAVTDILGIAQAALERAEGDAP